MKAKIKTLFAAAAVAAVLPVQAAALDKVQDLGKELTGDTGLACEAILCLSSSERPSECARSLQRYFSINHKRLGDTIRPVQFPQSLSRRKRGGDVRSDWRTGQRSRTV